MADATYDLVIIGGGTAGIVAAKTAAMLGGRVALIERDRPGGDCLWTGCVPSKALIAAAHAAHTARSSAHLGIPPTEPEVDFAAVMGHVRSAITAIEPDDSPATLSKAGVEVIAGTGNFCGLDEVRVIGADGVEQRLRFRHAMIATGTGPVIPPVSGLVEVKPLTTETVWELEDLPPSLLVIGGGATGCELGQAFARLGSRVTIVDRAERLLATEDAEVSRRIAARLAREGVRVLVSTSVDRIAAAPSGVDVRLTGPQSERSLVVDKVLTASGRQPRTKDLGLDHVGVRLDDRGFVQTDTKLRTTNPRIFAAGDVTGRPPFTHVAGAHGSVVATNALFGPLRTADDDMPSVTFTDPEVAHIGMTLAQARAKLGDGVRVRTIEHDTLDRAITGAEIDGFTQIVLDGPGHILGATIVGPRAGEMLSALLVLRARKGRLRDLAGVVHPYPSWSYAVWNASLAELYSSLASPTASITSRALRTVRRLLLTRRTRGSR